MIVLGGCDLPRDPEATLKHVRGATLKVGTASPDGLSDQREKAALRAFAERTRADIVVQRGELHALVQQLEKGQIHLIAGRLPKDTPLSKKIALSSPVSTIRRESGRVDTVFGIRKGENAFLYMLDKSIRSRK